MTKSIINIAITSTSLPDADMFGEFIAAACRENGFKDVTIDTASNSEFSESQQAVTAMRALNPDLFNYGINITTDQTDDQPPPDEASDESY